MTQIMMCFNKGSHRTHPVNFVIS